MYCGFIESSIDRYERTEGVSGHDNIHGLEAVNESLDDISGVSAEIEAGKTEFIDSELSEVSSALELSFELSFALELSSVLGFSTANRSNRIVSGAVVGSTDVSGTGAVALPNTT